MVNESNGPDPWPSPKVYGERFDVLNRNLERSFAAREQIPGPSEEFGILRYRLAKIAIAAEDIRRAITFLEREEVDDDTIATAVVELRNACAEVTESFAEADDMLIRLLNSVS